MKKILQKTIKASLLLCILASLPFFSFAQKWDTLAPIPDDFTFPVVVAADGKIHIMGGGASGSATELHYQYDPTTDTWAKMADLPYVAQQPAGAYADGKIHFFGGGYPNSGTPLADHQIYDIATDTWTKGKDLTAPRAIHDAAAVDGVVYSIGGQGTARLFLQAYDSDADTWSQKATLPDGNFWYGAHVGTEDRLYRFGGGGFRFPTDAAHMYDPDNNIWTALPKLPVGNHSIQGAAIGKKIYLVGGYYDFEDRPDIYIYDTEEDTYTKSDVELPIGRSYHRVVAVDDCIYVLGGNNAIDPTIGTQIIRYCFQDPLNTSNLQTEALTAHLAAGTISLQLPENISDDAQLTVYDVTGRQLHAEHLPAYSTGTYQVQLGQLPAALYLIHLQTKDTLYVGKVSGQ